MRGASVCVLLIATLATTTLGRTSGDRRANHLKALLRSRTPHELSPHRLRNAQGDVFHGTLGAFVELRSKVKFEADEHRSICREALKGLDKWFPATTVTLKSIDVLAENESTNDEVDIQAYCDGKSCFHKTKSMEKSSDPWQINAQLRFHETLRIVGFEEDNGRNAVDRDDLVGFWEPTRDTIAKNAGKDISFVLSGAKDSDGARYNVTLSIPASAATTAKVVSDVNDHPAASATLTKKSVRISKMICHKQEDNTGVDHLRMKVFADGVLKETLTHEMKSSGAKKQWDIHKKYDFLHTLTFQLTELDDLDPNDDLGEVSWSSVTIDAQGSPQPTSQFFTGWGVKYELIAGEGTTPATEHSIRVDTLKCVKQEDNTGKDDAMIDVYIDGVKKERIEKRVKSGSEVSIGKTYTFRNAIKFRLHEYDTFDPNDFLGDIEWTSSMMRSGVPTPAQQSWTKGGVDYKLIVSKAPGSFLESAARTTPGYSPINELKPITNRNGGTYWLTFADICALAGDFLAGPNAEELVIGYNLTTMQPRTEAASMEKFKTVFDSWYDVPLADRAFNLQMERLIHLFEIERNAIARHKGTKYSTNRAYAEHESDIGGTTLEHSTNSHNNNMAKASMGREPDIDYYSNPLTFALGTQKLAMSRFYANAIVNSDHFLDGNADKVYIAGLKVALKTALEAAKLTGKAQAEMLRRALAQAAAATHYGSDLFAAGHQRSAKRSLFADRVQEKCGDNEQERRENINIQAALFHDEDGDVGIWVKNQHKEWRAFGDRMFNHVAHQDGPEQGKLFIQATIKLVYEAFNGACSSVAACYATASTGTGPLTYLPDFKKATHVQFAPLYLKRGGKWYYRKHTFDYPVPAAVLSSTAVNAAFKRFYTDKWDCSSLIFDFTGDTSNKDRFDNKANATARLIAKEEALMKAYYEVMDRNRDRKVSLVEFKYWLQQNVPSLKRAEGDVVVSLYMTRFFAKFPSLNKTYITLQDLDVVLSSEYTRIGRPDPHPPQPRGRHGRPPPRRPETSNTMLTLRYFAIQQFRKILREHKNEQQRSGNFLEIEGHPAAGRKYGSGSGLHIDRFDPPEDREQVPPPSGDCVFAGVDLCNAVVPATAEKKEISKLSEADFQKQLASMKFMGFMQQKHTLADMERYMLDYDVMLTQRDIRMDKVMRREGHAPPDTSPATENYWFAMQVLDKAMTDPELRASTAFTAVKDSITSAFGSAKKAVQVVLSHTAVEGVQENQLQPISREAKVPTETEYEEAKTATFDGFAALGAKLKTAIKDSGICIGVECDGTSSDGEVVGGAVDKAGENAGAGHANKDEPVTTKVDDILKGT